MKPTIYYSADPSALFRQPMTTTESPTEYTWGDMEKSILFLSGFSAKDSALSAALTTWFSVLNTPSHTERFSAGFDKERLKKRCKIRIIPHLEENQSDLYRNGITKQENLLFLSEKTSIKSAEERGIDLNRNFNANWIKMKTRDPKRKDCGPFPESERAVAALVQKIKDNPPLSILLLRHGQNTLYYPKEATQKELKEAQFLAQWGGLPLRQATDTEGTALQWMTDRGIKTLELQYTLTPENNSATLQKILFLCAALT